MVKLGLPNEYLQLPNKIQDIIANRKIASDNEKQQHPDERGLFGNQQPFFQETDDTNQKGSHFKDSERRKNL
ncbi:MULTISPECIES: hypothetical protein [unclassified Lactococcus]|uniref:hypothetical protein n=1 Tax=unclassified Lactococcus TaxID=2643510 RepID=UPI0011C90046|nr:MULTISPECIES: hypothetical protein [unclassified Lactococcus]MQW22708.1 hypothetical protein [Lactococcus sp. dk101]TXK44715.1 hypothetical protein FVP42_03695 [Lactococcus sp. dk310]TXK50609.1 hypothetical protein FVP43_03695 [Lactococcus sp. dk322]